MVLAEPGVIEVGGVRAKRFRMVSTQSISADPGAIGFGSSIKPPPGAATPHIAGRIKAANGYDRLRRKCFLYSLYTRVRGLQYLTAANITVPDYDL